MNSDKWILVAVWIMSLGLLVFVPKEKRLVSQLAFLFKQLITWILGLVVVQYGLIVYPVRLIETVNRSSFTFEFMAYPAVCSFFNAYYPEKHDLWVKIRFYVTTASVMTAVEWWLESQTALIDYIHWGWYDTWLSLVVTLFISRRFCVWYFKPGRI